MPPSYAARTAESQRLPLLQTSSSALDDDDNAPAEDEDPTPTALSPAPHPLRSSSSTSGNGHPPSYAARPSLGPGRGSYRDEEEAGEDAALQEEMRSFSPLYGRNLRSTVQSREMRESARWLA